MKIVAFAGSNSKNSINKKLAAYAVSHFENGETEVLDLNDFVMPIYSVDLEKEIAAPEAIGRFLEKIKGADILVVSLAENNGSFNAGFKNIFDWVSRTDQKQFQNKPMLLMATSPGKRGGSGVLLHAQNVFPHYGGNIKVVFSLPSFNDNFQEGKGITDPSLNSQLKTAVADIQAAVE